MFEIFRVLYKKLCSKRKEGQEFFGFFLVGALGFLADAGLLTFFVSEVHINIHAARILSFSCAVFVTWFLNRSFVFHAERGSGGKKKISELVKYFSLQILGACLNIGVFSSLILLYPSLEKTSLIPLCAGSLLAMLFTFTGMKFFVFRTHKKKRDSHI